MKGIPILALLFAVLLCGAAQALSPTPCDMRSAAPCAAGSIVEVSHTGSVRTPLQLRQAHEAFHRRVRSVCDFSKEVAVTSTSHQWGSHGNGRPADVVLMASCVLKGGYEGGF